MKFSNKFTFIATLLLIVVIASSCKNKHDSIGNLDEIIVFADSLDWLDYKAGLDTLFEKEYLTPMPEVSYLLRWKPADQIANYKTYTNLMFIARLDGKDPVSRDVKGLLNEEIIEGIKSGDYFYIPQQDPWAFDQYVLYLVAPTKDEMIQRIYDLGELAFDDFEKSYYSRLKDKLYSAHENKKLEDYLLEHFPFTLRVQHDYGIVDESQEERYVWLRRLHPSRDRSLAVHWIPYNDSIEIDFDWIVNQRNTLASKIFNGDVVVKEETHLERVKFGRWPAYRLEGTWKNPELIIGGPFRTIVFVDKKSDLIFMIDFYVQAIGERKKVFLDQLDIMAHTFRSKSYIEEES